MPELPNHSELVETYRLQVVGDPDTTLTDFSDGSVNRGFSAIAATAARGSYRWMARLARRAFIQAAEDADLDYAIADRLGEALPRRLGESNEDYRTRFYTYLASALERGTERAWRYFLGELLVEVDASASHSAEDLAQGGVTLVIVAVAGTTPAAARVAVETALPEWRIQGIPVTLEVS